MIGGNKHLQEAGDNSTNLQGQTININNGISYADAKNIALDVFKANYLQLSQEAAQTARSRAEELIDNFLDKVKNRNPNAFGMMNDPGIQSSIYTAQKEYAKTGDKDLSDLLVDILVERTKLPERNLKQIVLDECLNIAAKLTSSQLNTLSTVFLLKYSQNSSINSHVALNSYLITYLKPFSYNLSKENSLYQHLEYVGCGSISVLTNSVEGIFSDTYRGLFSLGFTLEQFESTLGSAQDYPFLLTPCLNDKEKFQINAVNQDVLFEKLKLLNRPVSDMNKFKPFLEGYMMPISEIKEFLVNQEAFMSELIDVWNNSSMKNMTLTSVGIAIATANIRTVTGIHVDLDIWIK